MDDAGDVVTELASQGTDTVQSYLAAYTLAANVENLTLMGVQTANGTGNSLANTITGNAANNVLTGGAGADTFVWQAGARGTDMLTDFSLAQADKLDVKALLQSIGMGNSADAASYLDLRQGLGANAADAVLTVHAADSTAALQDIVLTNAWAELQTQSIGQLISQGVLVA